MIQVSKNIFVENSLPYCNLGLISTTDGLVMVDTPTNPIDAVKWRDVMQARGTIKYIINTEEHGDHCTNSWFYPGILVTSEETRKKQTKRSATELIERVKKRDPVGGTLMEGFQIRLADITFNKNLDLFLGDHTISLMPLPGHSSGGIGVFIPEERVIFTTDCVFHKAKTWLQECLPDEWFASLERIRKLDVGVIIPGHGTPCDKSYLDEQEEIIRKWISLVRSCIDKGMTETEAIATITAPDPYPKVPPTIPISEPDINRMSVSRLYQVYASKK